MCFGIPVLNGRTPVDKWTTWRHTGRSESVPKHSWAAWWVAGTSGRPTSRLVGDKKTKNIKKKNTRSKKNGTRPPQLGRQRQNKFTICYFQLVGKLSAAKDTTVFGFDLPGLRISKYLMQSSSSALEVKCYPGCQQNNNNIFSSIPMSFSIYIQVAMGKCKEEQWMKNQAETSRVPVKPTVLTTTAASCVLNPLNSEQPHR